MITGPNGFLYNELDLQDSEDLLFLLGGPTTDDESKLDEYVKSTKELINNNTDKYVVFASNAWIDNHNDSYSNAKKELEQFIKQRCTRHLILRIGDIISKDISKVRKMKSDRMQQQILRNELSDIPLKSHYLDLEQFVKETKNVIENKNVGIYHYNLTELTLMELKNYAN